MPRTKTTKKDTKEKDIQKEEDMDTDDLLEQSETILDAKKKADSPKKKGRQSQKAQAETDSTTNGTTPKKTGKGRKKTSVAANTTPKTENKEGAIESKQEGYERQRTKELAERYPDHYWKYHADAGHAMINTINEEDALEPVACNISDQGAITGMVLSPNGLLLATFSAIGSVKIWDIGDGLNMVQKLRDADEKNIDEFYCGQFVADAPDIVVAAGKLKDRHRWSEDDEDNHILPCPIKIFNMETGKVIARLEGHDEEVLGIKTIRFNGENYYISTSQDGRIIKWHMADDWYTLLHSERMIEEETCMAFTVSFLPNTGNKYFLAACDEHLRLYDFEHRKLLQTFEDLYSSYCDCGKFINWLDEPAYWEGRTNESSDQEHAWFISRGAEMCDVSGGVSSTPNTCTLHRLVYPKKDGDLFVLEEIKKYKHEDYHSNSWLVKITSNGRYLLAPTMYGQLFVFNLLSGQLTAIIKHHEDIEIRDVLFHPYAPLIFSSADDGLVKVYTYKGQNDDSLLEDTTMEEKSISKDEKVNQDLNVGSSSSASASSSSST